MLCTLAILKFCHISLEELYISGGDFCLIVFIVCASLCMYEPMLLLCNVNKVIMKGLCSSIVY
jgi:hypothetical protein